MFFISNRNVRGRKKGHSNVPKVPLSAYPLSSPELQGSTAYVEAPKYTAHADMEPLRIQFLGNPVRLRNIWVRENIKPFAGLKPEPPVPPEVK